MAVLMLVNGLGISAPHSKAPADHNPKAHLWSQLCRGWEYGDCRGVSLTEQFPVQAAECRAGFNFVKQQYNLYD